MHIGKLIHMLLTEVPGAGGLVKAGIVVFPEVGLARLPGVVIVVLLGTGLTVVVGMMVVVGMCIVV